jgi:hypothetical protein
MIKEAGFRNMPDFLGSYGLKMHDDGQLAEGKAILGGLREVAQREWESGQGKGGK